MVACSRGTGLGAVPGLLLGREGRGRLSPSPSLAMGREAELGDHEFPIVFPPEERVKLPVVERKAPRRWRS